MKKMGITTRLKARPLRARLGSERGIAMPVVLSMLVVCMALGGVMITSTISAQRGTTRDDDSKRSLTASDSGVGIALNRYREVETSQATPCVVEGGSGSLQAGTAGAGGWCAPITETVDDQEFTYQVRQFFAGDGERTFQIVSVGSSDEIARRVFVQARNVPVQNFLSDFGVVGKDLLHIQGNANIYSSVATNGDVQFTGGSGGICGEIVQYGEGNQIEGDNQPDNCDEAIVYQEGRIELPAIDGVPQVHDNANLDGVSGWDATTRTLTKGTVLTEGTYVMCRIHVNGGNQELSVAPGHNVRIYFDTPSNCGLSTGATQLYVGGNAYIGANAKNATGPNDSFNFQVYMTGTETSKVDLRGTGDATSIMVYAPFADIELGGNPTYFGSFIGKSVYIHGSGNVTYDGSQFDLDLGDDSVLVRDVYVECTGAQYEDPLESC